MLHDESAACGPENERRTYKRELVAATGSRGRSENLMDGRRTLLPGDDRDTRFSPTTYMRRAGGVL